MTPTVTGPAGKATVVPRDENLIVRIYLRIRVSLVYLRRDDYEKRRNEPAGDPAFRTAAVGRPGNLLSI